MMFSCKKLFGFFGGTVALTVVSLGLSQAAQAETFYVIAGSSGTTKADALNPNLGVPTIQKVLNDYVGTNNSETDRDIINVSPGTYKSILDSANGYPGLVNVSGKSYLTIQARPGTSPKPIIQPADAELYRVIDVRGSNQIIIKGLEVNGLNGTATQRKDRNGVQISLLGNGPTAVPSRNIRIENCTVHDVGGGGIVTSRDGTVTRGCDYISIVGNTVYNTNSTGSFSSSAISLLALQNYNPSDSGVHNVVEKNRVFNNKANTGVATNDCNGIIVDVSVPFATPTNPPPRVLIQNNLVYGNSGRGIHIYRSSNVAVLNNTVYRNNTGNITSKGELTAGGNTGETFSNILFSNNVVEGDGTGNGTGSAPAFRAYGTFTLPQGAFFYKYNTYRNTQYANAATSATVDQSTTAQSVAQLFTSPGFTINASFLLLDQPGVDTALNKGSSVIGEFAWASFNGVTRYNGSAVVAPNGIDRGAYEQ